MIPLRSLLAAGVLAVTPGLAFAAGGGAHPPSWTLTILAAINFAIFALVLRIFAWPLVKNYLEERRDGIVKSLEAARQAELDAEQLRAEFEARMQTLESEAERAREELLSVARLEAERLLDQARRAAERIRSDARLVADQEVAQARRRLQEETAARITERAASLLERTITADDQRRLTREFIAETREANR